MRTIYDYTDVDDLFGAGVFSGHEVGEEHSGARVLCAEDPGDDHLIEYVDYLDIARRRGDLVGLTDEDGWLRCEVHDAVRRIVTETLVERWGMDRMTVAEHLTADDLVAGEEPHLIVALTYLTGSGTVAEMMKGYAAPLFGAMSRLTDPDTFNHPYLWDEVKRLVDH